MSIPGAAPTVARLRKNANNAAEKATFSEAHGTAPYPISRISTPIPDRAEKRGKLPLPHHEGGDDQASPKRAVVDHFEGRNPVQQIPVQRAQAEGQVHAEKDAHALPLREAARSSAG